MRKCFLSLRWKNILYAPLFLLLIMSTATTSVNATPDGLPKIYVDPPTATISAPGQTINVNVTVYNVTNYYGADFWIHYNSTIINCTNIDLWCDTVNPTGTQIYYSITYGNPIRVSTAFVYGEGAAHFDGNGTVACLTFKGLAMGVSNLTFNPTWTSMIEIDYFTVPPTLRKMTMDPPVDGEIEVIPEFPTATLMPLLLILTLIAVFLGKKFSQRIARRPQC